jgi:hypothetical protein
MKIEKFAMTKKKAYALWKEYIEACKDNPKDKFLQDMKGVYCQLKSGRKIVDIHKIFEAAGLNDKSEPKLAIAVASAKTVTMEYKQNGSMLFTKNFSNWSHKETAEDIIVSNVFPELPEQHWDDKYDKRKRRKTTVPAIPASLRPKGSLNNYYILWEVKKWEIIPPKDPYLLKRITPNMFVVLAGWNLTELERSVMKGRMV